MKRLILSIFVVGLSISHFSFAAGPDSHSAKGMAMKTQHANQMGQDKSAAGLSKATTNRAAAEQRKAAGQAHRPASAQ